MTSKAAGPTPSGPVTQERPIAPQTQALTAEDIRAALRAGIADFRARPVLSGFFGLVYAMFGLVILWGLVWLGTVWMVIPFAIGFPLVAPFAAAGLYEMSRRLENGTPFGWADILGVMAHQRKREMGWMAFVTLFVFWVWVYQFRTVLVIVLQDASFSDMSGFLNIVFTTPEGWTFLAIGTVIGAVLSVVLFSLTVISMPLLLDRDLDFVTAMVTSVRVVRENPRVMLAWGILIAAAVLLAMVPAFLGLIFVLPVLGHTTWHLYQRAVAPVPA